ncbi:hypothetical protein [Cellulosimicrobium funkei]
MTYRTAIIAGAMAVVGAGLLLAASWPKLMEPGSGWQVFVSQLGGILITTGGLGVLWELRGRRDVIEEVLDQVELSSDVKASGIRRASMDWKSIEWPSLFANAKDIVIFAAYASTWRNNHWSDLTAFSRKQGNSLTVILPDPASEDTMRVLARRYQYTPGKIKDRVEETARAFAGLSSPAGATVKVYYRDAEPTHTCYRFDDKSVVTLYSHKRARGDVPAFTLESGSFAEFFLDDLDAVRSQSREVPLAELTRNGGAADV